VLRNKWGLRLSQIFKTVSAEIGVRFRMELATRQYFMSTENLFESTGRDESNMGGGSI